MVKSLDEIAKPLVALLATHPKIPFEIDQDFFTHILTANYDLGYTGFSFKLPKGKMQSAIQCVDVLVEPITDVETELDMAPGGREERKRVVRYETSLSLRRVLKNSRAEYRPLEIGRKLGNAALRYAGDPIASIGQARSAGADVRRIPELVRELMSEADKLGNPISLIGRLQTIDYTMQILGDGTRDNNAPFWVIRRPILCIGGVRFIQGDHNMPLIFEKRATTYEKGIPNFIGQHALLIRRGKAKYQSQIDQYLAENPRVAEAIRYTEAHKKA